MKEKEPLVISEDYGHDEASANVRTYMYMDSVPLNARDHEPQIYSRGDRASMGMIDLSSLVFKIRLLSITQIANPICSFFVLIVEDRHYYFYTGSYTNIIS